MGTSALLLSLAPLFAASDPARAGTIVQTWAVEGKATHPGTIRITDAGGGAAIQVDLSALPAAARILRARLLVERAAIDGSDAEAMIRPEVFVGEKPLPIAGPWFDHFDATEAVRRWIAKRSAGFGLVVKALPKWIRERTRLEIAYEGTAREVPRQVTGVAARHRAGQTSITWMEVDDPFGERAVRWGELRERIAQMDRDRIVRYRIYRHTRPIDGSSIADATRIAEIKPFSGFNVNAWSKERLINQAVFGDEDRGELGKYGPFDGWDRDSEPGGRLVIPRFVIAGGAKPLAAGTGLYMHSTTEDGKVFYAVTVSVDGTENATEFSLANSLREPVDEKVAAWEPVLQGEGTGEFGFDFPGRKLFYATWVAPPLANLPSRAFNWSVHLPPDLSGPAPLDVSFHDLEFSYAKPVRRFDRRAVQIAGHDADPVSGWYGYHSSYGTLRAWDEGRVEPYTERRLLAFNEWAKRTWPIDPRRAFADGRGMGGLGAIHFACKHPDLFAYVLDDQGAVVCRDAVDLPVLEAAWGRVAWGLPNDQGVNVWDWQDLTWFIRRQGLGARLPVMSISPWGHTAWQDGYPRRIVEERETRWMTSHRHFTRFFKMACEHRQMIFAEFDWGASLGILPDWMDVTAGPTPVFTNSTDKDVKETEDGPFIFYEPSGSSPGGWIHWHHRWRSHDVIDRPDRLELTLYMEGSREATAHVTIRGAERFRPAPGETLRWSNTCLAEGEKTWELREIWEKYEKKRDLQSGTVTVGEQGLITIPGVLILPIKCRLVIGRAP